MTTKPRAGRQRYHLDGREVVGTTTVCNVISKGDALVRWANQQGLLGIDISKSRVTNVGGLVHAMVAAHLMGEQVDTDDFTKAEIDAAENSVLSFLEWAKRREIEVIRSEEPLVCEHLPYGGTADLYARVDGRLEVLDWKSGGLYAEHNFQIAAYRHLLEDAGFTVDACRLLSLPRTPDESFTEKVIEDTTRYWQVFKTAHSLYIALREAKNHG